MTVRSGARHLRRAALAGLALGALGATDVALGRPQLAHEPPESGVRGRPLRVRAQVADDQADTEKWLHFLGHGGRDYHAVELVEELAGYYVAEIPAAATTGLKVRYYLELSAPDGGDSRSIRVGTPAAPIVVPLVEAQPPQVANKAIGAVSGGLLIALPVVVAHRWRRRRADIDRGFWTGKLAELASLEGSALQLEVARLCRRPIYHPVHGRRRYSPEEIHHKLLAVRGELTGGR